MRRLRDALIFRISSSPGTRMPAVPALAQAAAMPLLEETTLPQKHPPTVPVVIIGSGIFERRSRGRSRNPVAVLFDTLLHPNADFGYEFPPVLQWKRDKQQHVPHLVLGRATPGDVTSDRATPEEISSYYRNYVKLKGLQNNFVDNTYVTSVQKLCREQEGEGLENRHTDQGDGGVGDGGNQGFEGNGVDKGGGGTLWEVRGYQQVQSDTHVPFSLFAENIVLATGASDSPVHLGAEGEDLPFVFHSISDLGLAISRRKLDMNSDPVLIVGAGLSAADAVLCACGSNIRVLHVFRKSVDNPDLIFKQLPKTLYPEYHKVYNMMSSQTYTNVAPSSASDRPQAVSIASSVCAKMCPKPQFAAGNMAGTASVSLFPVYTSFPEHCVVSFQSDMTCLLQGNDSLKAFKISMALVLIGTNPNLFFLKGNGQYLGQDPTKPISCTQNPIDVHPYTYECVNEPGLFAMGPLVGDNFVRFLKGGALGIASCLLKRLKKKEKLISNGGNNFI
ncbi:hypothetical protein F7725_018479 [Dissostichus mawsoni]|uniref:Oxidative stress induced growth inhibitor family member 2 n=1 Tax=Dissostichus mawsoni TaxID=36200 RepID=A0A7J5XRN9_DISMA|nr:hypothetical protein F7725_018479 [Dissostichus mawsoni]